MRKLLLVSVVSFALAFGLLWFAWYETARVFWIGGRPYCADLSLAGANESAAAAGARDVAVCR